MSKSTANPRGSVPAQNEEIEWELRPGGMLVQRREDGDDGEADASSGGPMVKITVSNGKDHHEVFVPAQSTFGILLFCFSIFFFYVLELRVFELLACFCFTILNSAYICCFLRRFSIICVLKLSRQLSEIVARLLVRC